MTLQEHAQRLGWLLTAVAALMIWRVSSAEVISADGLRYITQAKKISSGDWNGGLLGSVDHPMYPLQIAAVRSIAGLPETPFGWQNAAWTASLIYSILLVIPLYLVGRELFGDSQAWLGVLAIFAVPMTSQILPDALSESTFLHFWSWSLYFALRFLNRGNPRWLVGVALAGALAYWTRPEGLLICIALVFTILICPILPQTRIDWPRFGQVLTILIVATALFSVPMMISRGTIGTKPAIAKVLGLKQRSGKFAVEREKPLDSNKTELEIWMDASVAYYRSTKQLTTDAGLFLALAGLIVWRRPNAAMARKSLFVFIILCASALALIRLHATQGYCAPRHTMIPSQLLLMAAGSGLYWLSNRLLDRVSGLQRGSSETRLEPGPLLWVAIGITWAIFHGRVFMKPIGNDALGYRQAAEFLSNRLQANEHVADLTGWTPYYADRPGYTFATINEAFHDPYLRYVVVREAHLIGPWDYCRTMERLTSGAIKIAQFPDPVSYQRPRQSRVLLFEKRPEMASAVKPIQK